MAQSREIKDIFVELNSNNWTAFKISKFMGYGKSIAHILGDMVTDLTDTFKPYKSTYYSRLDWAQPYFGIKNTALGLLGIMLTPLRFLWDIGHDLLISKSLPNFFKNLMISVITVIPSVICDSAKVLRGVTQIVASPLMLAKKFFRNIVTLIVGKPKFEDSSSVKKLVNDAGDGLRNRHPIDHIIYKIHREYLKEVDRGVQTNISILDEDRDYKAIKTISGIHPSLFVDPNSPKDNYVSLFSNAINQSKDGYQEPVAIINSDLRK